MVRRVRLSLGFLLFLALAGVNPALSAEDTHLFVLLDGVSYHLIKDLKDSGRLEGFGEPARVISAFPSTTVMGITGLFKPLGAEKAKGYDKIYYSYQNDRVEGSLLTAIRKSKNSYETFFDGHHATFWRNVLVYMTPGHSVQTDLGRLQKMLRENPSKRQWLYYIPGTDGSAHVLGKERQKRLVLHIVSRLNVMARRHREQTGRGLNLILLSDHGFDFNRLKGIPRSKLKKRLEENGFTLRQDLSIPRSVIAIEWGNISGAAFYTHPKNVEEVAGILGKIPGNDLTFYRYGESVRILDAQGNLAQIDAGPKGRSFRYRPLRGDPLGYASSLAGLKKSGRLDARGFASQKSWFQATKDARYPDVPYRVHQAFGPLVKNPAPIIISTDDHHEYGSGFTRFLANLRGSLKGTHGAVFDTASDAFVLTNRSDWKLPPVMRYEDVFVQFDKLGVSPKEGRFSFDPSSHKR